MQLMMFTKHLAPLPLREAARAIQDLGFDGADLTVRPGGYVDPTNVRAALPEAISILNAHGLAAGLLTTAITSASDPAAAMIFESAASAGVREIKLGYWKYDRFGTFASALDQVARDLDGIEQLARRTKVRANLHTHSENFLTAFAPIVWHLIKERDPSALGTYVDPGHMSVEGGGDGWRMGLDLLARRISVVAVKDLDWARTDGADELLAKPRWYTRIVPLSQGIVPWPNVFACLRASGFDGWISLHSEYQGPHSWRELTTQEVIEQTRNDLTYLRQAIAQSASASTNAVNRRAPRG
jgi:sugar phosphate isomerase/epimerase